ncbi:MAG: transposase [Planctomycetes bacterium]|nr:transposase [Planctomycetota bacterium]
MTAQTPHAELVHDKFHVAKHLRKVVDQVRRAGKKRPSRPRMTIGSKAPDRSGSSTRRTSLPSSVGASTRSRSTA